MPRPYTLNRERTAMTIEEFYAPTPTPAKTPGNFTRSSAAKSITAIHEEKDEEDENSREFTLQNDHKMVPGGADSFEVVQNQGEETGEYHEQFADSHIGGAAIPVEEEMADNGFEFVGNKQKGAPDDFAQNDLDFNKTAGTIESDSKLPPKPPPMNNANRRRPENFLGSSSVSPKPFSSHFPQQPTVAQVSKSYADSFALPKEQASLTNKTLDFVPVENLSSANTTRFVINQHVPIHLAGKRRSDTTPRKNEKLQNGGRRQKDQNPVNLRRPKRLQSLKPEPESQAKSGGQQSPQDMGQPLDKPKMIPKAVSFIIADRSFPGGPAPGAVPKRNANVSNVKYPLGSRAPKAAPGMGSEGRQQQRAAKVQYSSASSWKDKRDLLTLQPKDAHPVPRSNVTGGGRGRGGRDPDIYVLGSGPHPPGRAVERNSAGSVSNRTNPARALKESHSMPSLKIVPGASVGSSTSTVSITTLDQADVSSIANTSLWLDSSKSEAGGSDEGTAQSQLS